jgi:N-acetyl-gamma-glutamylphosphate reductase
MKYSQNFPIRTAYYSESDSVARIVLLTGTTGGIGASLLSLLLQDHTVSKVYAINRRSSSGIKIEKRHKSIYDKQGFDYETLLRAIQSGQLVFIESTISDASLQVPQSLLQEVRILYLFPSVLWVN